MDEKIKSEQLEHWKAGLAKSSYLGSWDLPSFENIQLTIKEVKKHMTSGLKDNEIANIIYWIEKGYKPMILNATNAKMLRALTGSPFINDWAGHKIELRVEKDIKAFGGVHDGLRIVNKKIKVELPLLDSKHPKYDEILGRIVDGSAKLDVVSKYYKISDEFKDAIKNATGDIDKETGQ